MMVRLIPTLLFICSKEENNTFLCSLVHLESYFVSSWNWTKLPNIRNIILVIMEFNVAAG